MADLDRQRPHRRHRPRRTPRHEPDGAPRRAAQAPLHSVFYLLAGFVVAYIFHVKLYGFIQAPLDQLHIPLNYTHPTDGLNLYLKTSLFGGAILASPFILYQLWLFISPGMYANEKTYVVPFMAATVGLFLAGAWFGYRYVLPGALNVLINGFGKQFHPIITIDDYTGFFLAIILGLGVYLRAADHHLLPRPLRHRRRQVPAQARPLRHPHHLPHRGHHLPAARPLQHVPLRLAHAGALLRRRRRSRLRRRIASRPARKARSEAKARVHPGPFCCHPERSMRPQSSASEANCHPT